MTTYPNDSTKENAFPRMVYRKGTGRQVNEAGLYEAEGQVVYDEQQLAKLGSDWCSSPAEAVGQADSKKPAKAKETRWSELESGKVT